MLHALVPRAQPARVRRLAHKDKGVRTPNVQVRELLFVVPEHPRLDGLRGQQSDVLRHHRSRLLHHCDVRRSTRLQTRKPTTCARPGSSRARRLPREAPHDSKAASSETAPTCADAGCRARPN
eukprot:3278911-Pleurochrysis_carterae.AAC.1